tara:strand:+ start:645 stop:818 length:174 start_codon:yes stop_codon:yes gene_type:complete
MSSDIAEEIASDVWDMTLAEAYAELKNCDTTQADYHHVSLVVIHTFLNKIKLDKAGN